MATPEPNVGESRSRAARSLTGSRRRFRGPIRVRKAEQHPNRTPNTVAFATVHLSPEGRPRPEIDHATSWNDGGPTSRANLGALCKRHHQLKTFAGWDLPVTSPLGDCFWTSPAGRRYRWEPPPLSP